jgi:L-iditol 2-dehydrogenase
MKQLICPATGQLDLIDTPVPAIGPGELLLQMEACGICGTDLMKVYDPYVAKPVQLGHELVGTVSAVDSAVSRFAPGQRVAVAHHVPDYSSHYTRRNSAPMDGGFKQSNIDPGGFAEYIRVPALQVTHTTLALPATLPTARAIFIEPLACCLRALDRVTLYEGDTVLVVGVGAVGLLFVPLLCDRSVMVFATDLRPAQLQAAQAWGAHDALHAAETDVSSKVRAASAGRGADLVILTVANQVTLNLALGALRDGGTLLLFGAKPGDQLNVLAWELWRREINWISSYSTTPDLLPRALAILNRPAYALETMISQHFPLEAAPAGFALAHSGQATKVVITHPGG